MAVRIYVWKKPGGSTLNYFIYTVGLSKALDKFLDFQTSVGHASLEIEINNSEKKYISHRPKPLEEKGRPREFVTDLSNQPSLLDHTTYEDECDARQEKPYFLKTLEGLDETGILDTYEKECAGGKFSYSHGLNNNCCKVVYTLLKVGLGCGNKEKCEFCDHIKYAGENPINNIGMIFILLIFMRINLHRLALLILKDGCNLNALSRPSDVDSSSLIRAAKHKILESWTPVQIINFVREIDRNGINRCQKNEVIKSAI